MCSCRGGPHVVKGAGPGTRLEKERAGLNFCLKGADPNFI